jgi:hypothetical protein
LAKGKCVPVREGGKAGGGKTAAPGERLVPEEQENGPVYGAVAGGAK